MTTTPVDLDHLVAGALTRDVIIAYLVVRRERYPQSSGTYCAIEELIAGLARGDDEEAHKHGEFDDILCDRSRWPWTARKL